MTTQAQDTEVGMSTTTRSTEGEEVTAAILDILTLARQIERSGKDEAVSVRSLARRLNYTAEFINIEIVPAIARGGFTYCLDHTIADGHGGHYDRDVCYYGPDQLRSRLESLSNMWFPREYMS